jgi:23S rRNA (pseudouridine1915-N3)-methyltransferase
MKLTFYTLPSGSDPESESLIEQYQSKISRFVPIQIIKLKPKKIEGSRSELKKTHESELILQKSKEHSQSILFDEGGKQFSDSIQFSQGLVKQLSSNDVAFFIGGAFGLTKEHKKEFKTVWSLGSLTMNHHLAAVVALEQLYRGLTIWKNHPYHNE